MTDTSLARILIHDPAVAALAGNRVYHLHFPSQPVYPLIVYQSVTAPIIYTMSGISHSNPMYQFVCWSDDDLEASQLADAVQDALDGVVTVSVKAAYIENRLDRYETDTKLHSRIVEVSAIV
jgi:hypothetical protein